MRIELELNGAPASLEAAPDDVLLDVLRDAGLRGPKECCGVGVCGACTVLADDLPVSACLYLAGCATGARVWTVEGVARRAPELVDAFVEAEAMQCGICTPGQVVSAFALSLEPEPPTDAELRRQLAGNLCRCTGYQSILEAVRSFLDRR